MPMGHNFQRKALLPLDDITIVKGPKCFGGLREGWWKVAYKNKRYKFFGRVITFDRANEVGYDQIKHIKELAAEAIVLNSAEEDNDENI